LQCFPQKRIKNSQKRSIFTQKQGDFFDKNFQVIDIQREGFPGFGL
jgi:hypothetical protein